MKITLLEPFFTGSHAAWAAEYAARSRHQVEILSLPGRHWKWRMHGGAVALARQFLESSFQPDLILATDMLDLTTFLALTRARTALCKTAVYFHENQLTYPWSPADADTALKRDMHYAFINYSSALAADAVFFNSAYHLKEFIAELPAFLRSMPDKRELATIEAICRKSSVLPLGLDLKRFDAFHPTEGVVAGDPPLVLWNHRWEYDKNPESFFRVLERLAAKDLAFRVVVLGESFASAPPVFQEARQRLGDRIVQFGFAASFVDYARWLWQAHVLPVTSCHDFFGASVIQALYCGCIPILPRRLAYPEHLPGAGHERYFYDDDTELELKLEGLLTGETASADSLADAVRRYDWQVLTAVYDDVLERVLVGS
jgi:glycosyltransferase involved in cell wall biosynthesis